MRHPQGTCAACGRIQPVKKGYCRLCWCQASLQARGMHSVLPPFLERIRYHQLFFAGMKLTTRWHPQPQLETDSQPGAPLPAAAPGAPAQRPVQLLLFEASRDFTRFSRPEHANLGSPWVVHGRQVASQLGEARGWTPKVRRTVDRALVMLLSGYRDGEVICYSELFPVMREHDLSIERTVEVLGRLGIFRDDRNPAVEVWLARALGGLAPGIARETEAWARALLDGGPRSRARSQDTVRVYLNALRPALTRWSSRYGHLREVTRDDVNAVLAGMDGVRRARAITALHSLFAWCKKRGIMFRDPARLIKSGSQAGKLLQPLGQDEVDLAAAAAVTPAARLILALAAVHAARPGAIRKLRLDDIDLGNRRLTIAGRTRPLDDLTRDMLTEWLDCRRARWPQTANPHLIVNQQTVMETGPVGGGWISEALRGQPVTAERLRMDRHLDEALARGPDPLHLAAVFGISHKTAIRYANIARQLLETAAESPAIPARPPDTAGHGGTCG
jgi:integrase